MELQQQVTEISAASVHIANRLDRTREQTLKLQLPQGMAHNFGLTSP